MDTERAREYLKTIDLIKPGHSEFWIHWPNRDSVELSKILTEFSNQQNKNLLEQNQWISVEEKYPEEHQIVWAMEKNHQGPVMMHFFYVPDEGNSGWAWAKLYDVPGYHKGQWDGESEYDDNYEVTHWMSLPEPPQLLEGLTKNNGG